MEKYFSNTYQSGIVGSKPFSGFSSMIAISPKQKTKELTTSHKPIQERSFNEKGFTFKKEFNKTANFIPSSERTSFKSVEKNDNFIKSSKNLVSEWKPKTNYFAKKK
jgi:hypothetical protein